MDSCIKIHTLMNMETFVTEQMEIQQVFIQYSFNNSIVTHITDAWLDSSIHMK